MTVLVPRTVLEAIEEVRQSGLTNMLDRPQVIRILRMMGHNGAARWVENNRDKWGKLVFEGPQVDENAESHWDDGEWADEDYEEDDEEDDEEDE